MKENIRFGDLSDDFVDIATSGVDIATDILGGIPIVGTALNAARSVQNITNTLFVRKVQKLLTEIDTGTPSEDRLRFIAELESQDDTTHFGEAVILLIDKMDDMQKPQIVGRLFAASIRGQLELKRSMRLATIVNSIFMGDLTDLVSDKNSSEGKASLAAAGLLEQTSMTISSSVRTPFDYAYQRSRLGDDLVKYGLTPYAAGDPEP